MTEAAISTRNGTTGDFADFAIAISRHARVGNLAGLPYRSEAADCLFGEPSPALPD
jgi:hypothetical protein